MFEDHSAATFRVRKVLVPESILYAHTADVTKDAALHQVLLSIYVPCQLVRTSKEYASHLQSRKYHWLLDCLWNRDENLVEGEPRLRAELDQEAYELVLWHALFVLCILCWCTHGGCPFLPGDLRRSGPTGLEADQGFSSAACEEA